MSVCVCVGAIAHVEQRETGVRIVFLRVKFEKKEAEYGLLKELKENTVFII